MTKQTKHPAPGRTGPGRNPPGHESMAINGGGVRIVLRFESKPGAWVVTDRSGFIVDVSEAGAELFGLTARQMMFRELSPFFDRPVELKDVERLLPGETVSHAVAIRGADGTFVPTIVEITHTEEWERGMFRWQFAVAAG